MKEVCHQAIQYGVYLRLARLRCIYFFRFQSAGRQSSPPHCQSRSTICRPFRLEKVKTLTEELIYNYRGVIKMSVNTNIFAGKFVFSLRFCRSTVCIRHVLKPGTPEHRNSGTLRNTPEHSGTLRNTGTPRNTGTAETARNTESDSVGLFSYYRPCKKWNVSVICLNEEIKNKATS